MTTKTHGSGSWPLVLLLNLQKKADFSCFESLSDTIYSLGFVPPYDKGSICCHKMSPEQQEEMLSNLKVQLNNQVRFNSLQILCARKVAESFPNFAKRRLIKFSSVLPKTLCSLVYKEFLQSGVEDSDGVWMNKEWGDCDFKDKVNLFAGYGLEEFECRILNADYKTPENYKTHRKPFELLAKESPKLRSFKDTCFYPYYDAHRNVNNQLLSDYYSLQSMSILVRLELKNYPVKDADLKVIGTCLPLLQCLMLFAPLEVGALNSSISIQGLEYLRNLEFLKHLTFVFRDPEHNESVQIVKNCLQLMPRVNTMGTSFSGGLNLVRHEFPSFEDPVELGLEHLVLGENTIIPSNVTLPNVTRITVLETLNVSLKRFKKLRHLSFWYLYTDDDWSQLVQIISEVGPLLNTLHLSHNICCDLMQIFQLCPNLYELNLDHAVFADNFNVFQLRNYVTNLKSLKREFDNTDSENFFYSEGILHLLLTSCPELEELQINAIRLTKAEIDLINQEIDTGAHSFQKLQKVEISAVLDNDALVSFSQFACNLCSQNCKILKNVNINERDNEERTIPDLEFSLKMQDCINNHAIY